MPTLEEIETRQPGALNSIPINNWERKALPTVLQIDEYPDSAVKGVYNNRIGILVVTDRRAIFIDKGIFGIKVEDFQFDRITSVTHKTGLFSGDIVLTVAGNICEIKAILKTLVAPTADLIRSKLHALDQTALSATVSVADEIERLAGLRDSGALTEDEFSQAKQRLLGR